jgi:hypothetical protein
MARPKKIGMDYFPVDTTWDVKMQLIKAKYGLEGIGCIIELFKTIYHEGYYIKWDDDTRLLFASENKIDENKLAEIVGFAVQKGVFHAGKLDKLGVLTSRGIQKRWLQVAKDSNRTTREIDKNIDLMKETEFPAQETEFPAQIIPGKNVVSGTDNPHIILNEIILDKIKEDKKENIIPTPSAVAKVEQKETAIAKVKPEPDPLYQAIFQSFIGKAGAFTNYPKEAQAIKRIIKYCAQHAPRYSGGDKIKLAEKIITKYFELTRNGDRFWRGQPFTPSSLSAPGIFDRVLVEIGQAQEGGEADDIPF